MENDGIVSGGAFQGAVENRSTISGGTFHGTVENIPIGTISGGTFQNTVENQGNINGGTFSEEVKNEYNGFIAGGTFVHFVTNNYRINGGTFRGWVTNNGYINGGTFENTVGNSEIGIIEGGTFSFYINNKGTVIKAKLLGAPVSGNAPQSVIHNVNGVDKPLTYGGNLLDELGDTDEGKMWYSGNTYISGGTVPMNYTEYTQKDHTHNYVYTSSGNVLTETCSNGCGHTAKATLTIPEESYAYTGEHIMPAVLLLDDNWQGNNGNGYTYTNNVDVGTATVTANPAGKTITATFEITPANIRNATVTLDEDAFVYDGDPNKPTVAVTFNGKTLTEGTDYELWYMSSDQVHKWDGEKPDKFFGNTQSDSINAGQYYAVVYGKGNFAINGRFAYAPYIIMQREVRITWGNTAFIYDGTEKFPECFVDDIVAGDDVQMTFSGSATNASEQHIAEITGLVGEDADNYKLPNNTSVPFSIAKADQASPTVSKTDETISKKADGKITGVDPTMEYRAESESTYTPITGGIIENLKPGKYYVRVKGDSNHNASADTALTIAAGRKLTVTLPQNPVGYSVTATAEAVDYGEAITVTLTVHEGYRKTDAFKCLLNGAAIPDSSWTDSKTFTLNGVIADAVITVEGIAEIPAPAPGNPPTGDNSAPELWFILLLISSAAILGLALNERKRQITHTN